MHLVIMLQFKHCVCLFAVCILPQSTSLIRVAMFNTLSHKRKENVCSTVSIND